MGTAKPQLTRPGKRLYDLSEAGEYLGRSVAAVRALVSAGRIRAVRIDRKVQFDIRDLDHLIDSSKCSVID